MKNWLIIVTFLLHGFLQAAETPIAAAQELIDALKLGPIKVESETAISRFCQESRKMLIQQRMDQLSGELSSAKQGEKTSPELLEQKIDQDLAVLIYRYQVDYKPFTYSYLGFCLLKAKDGKWKVCPVLESFQNSDLLFDLQRQKRATELELWMMKKLSLYLKEEEAQRTERFIAKLKEAEERMPVSADAWAQLLSFRKAIQNRDFYLALAHTYHQINPENFDPDGEEFRELFRIISEACGPDAKKQPMYDYLSAPGLVLARGDFEADGDNEGIQSVYYRLEGEMHRMLMDLDCRRVGTRWRFKLSENWTEVNGSKEKWRWKNDQDELETERGEAFFERAILRELAPPKALTAQAAAEQFILATNQEDWSTCLSLFERSPLEDPSERLQLGVDRTGLRLIFEALRQERYPHEGRLKSAARDLSLQWSVIKTLGMGAKAYLAKVETDGDLAIVHWFAADAAGMNFKRFTLELVKHGENWGIALPLDSANYVDRAKKFMLLKERQKLSDQDISQILLDRLSNQIKTLRSPAEKANEASPPPKAVWQQILSTLEKEKIETTYPCLALLPIQAKQDAKTSISDVIQVMRGLKRMSPKFESIEWKQQGRWACISVGYLINVKKPDKQWQMYVFTVVEGKWCLLPQLQLSKARNVGREQLNDLVWAQVEQSLKEQDIKDLKELFTWHSTRGESPLKP